MAHFGVLYTFERGPSNVAGPGKNFPIPSLPPLDGPAHVLILTACRPTCDCVQVQRPGLFDNVRAELGGVRAALVGASELARWSVVRGRDRWFYQRSVVLH